MEARVAVPEQIAKDTRDALLAIRAEIKDVRADHKSDFRWLPSLMIAQFGAQAGMILGLAGLMARHFGWL